MEHAKKKSPLNFIVGFVVFALALTGVISIAGFLGGRVQTSVAENKAEKMAFYEEFISPVIMNDPDTFDDITKANAQQLLSIAIWSVIDKSADPEKYEYTDDGMLMPQKEVEKMFRSLFGDEVKLTHCTVDGGEGVEFKYSEKKKCYVIPITGITPIYLPDVTEAEEKNNAVILTVGYLTSSDWVQDSEGNMVPPEPGKYMKITLGKNSDGGFYVRAIQTAD